MTVRCCRICETPAPVVSGLGLCPVCSSYPALVRAFAEGLAREAVTAALVAAQETPTLGG